MFVCFVTILLRCNLYVKQFTHLHCKIQMFSGFNRIIKQTEINLRPFYYPQKETPSL